MASLSLEDLIGPVRRALDDDQATIIDWIAKALDGGMFPATVGVFLLSGTARVKSKVVPWSLVLKVSQSHPWFVDARSHAYWRREGLAYASDLLDQVTGDLVAVQRYGVEDRGDEMWCWLELVQGEGAVSWDLERRGLAARHFGTMAGRYATGQWPLPDQPWLIPQFLRTWTQEMGRAVLDFLNDRETWEHPLVRAAFPEPVKARWCALWEDAEVMLDVLEELPRTLCHNDPISGNLFSRLSPDGRVTTVAIDWAFLSVGAVGQDLGAILSGDLMYGLITARDMPEYEALALPRYLEGIELAGYTVPMEHLRFAYAATAALKHGTFWAVMTQILLLEDDRPSWLEAFGARHGWSLEMALERWGEGLYYLLNLADEARMLSRGQFAVG